MLVIHTAGGLGERYGGPSQTITRLASSLGHSGVRVILVAGIAAEVDGCLVRPDSDYVDLTLVRAYQCGQIRLYPDFSKKVSNLCNASFKHVLIHDHGLWGHNNYGAWRASRKAKVPYVLSPRGMMESWALNHRLWKKNIALALYQKRILNDVSLFIATAESEYESIRKMGLKCPIAIIPNGIEAIDNKIEPALSGHGEGIRTALFLSRIHFKKGLINLLKAWALVNPPGWQLKIAGPDEGGYLEVVLNTVRQLGLSESVHYVGVLSGLEKFKAYHEADLFILPTFSENFGLVVAEALASGLPVITTKGAPWADLEIFSCGWWIDIGVEPLVRALREATSISDRERHAMGSRGRLFVRKFNWDLIAQQTVDVYKWVVGQGQKPNSVRID